MANWSTPSARELVELARRARRAVPRTQKRSTISSGTNVGVRVAGPAVLVVVVALAALDVVGQRLRARRAVGAVAARRCRRRGCRPCRRTSGTGRACGLEVVADVGGRGDADRDRVGVAAGLLGGLAHRLDRPRGDVGVGELQDEAVADLAGELRAPSGRRRPPTPRARAVALHGNRSVDAVVLDLRGRWRARG